MDCFQFAGLVHDLGRRRVVDADVRGEALAHAKSCLRCARLLAEVEFLDAALRSMAEEQADQRLEGRPEERTERRIESALVAEFRAAKAGAARRSLGWQAAAIVTAAMVLLTAGWALRHFAPGLNTTSPAVGTNGVASGSGSVPGVESQPVETVVAENGNGATFIRLPYASDGRTVEDDAIVRAVLPRSALASMGFPVGDMNASEPVPVELMVGEDGTPEAIRLVSQDIE